MDPMDTKTAIELEMGATGVATGSTAPGLASLPPAPPQYEKRGCCHAHKILSLGPVLWTAEHQQAACHPSCGGKTLTNVHVSDVKRFYAEKSARKFWQLLLGLLPAGAVGVIVWLASSRDDGIGSGIAVYLLWILLWFLRRKAFAGADVKHAGEVLTSEIKALHGIPETVYRRMWDVIAEDRKLTGPGGGFDKVAIERMVSDEDDKIMRVKPRIALFEEQEKCEASPDGTVNTVKRTGCCYCPLLPPFNCLCCCTCGHDSLTLMGNDAVAVKHSYGCCDLPLFAGKKFSGFLMRDVVFTHFVSGRTCGDLFAGVWRALLWSLVIVFAVTGTFQSWFAVILIVWLAIELPLWYCGKRSEVTFGKYGTVMVPSNGSKQLMDAIHSRLLRVNGEGPLAALLKGAISNLPSVLPLFSGATKIFGFNSRGLTVEVDVTDALTTVTMFPQIIRCCSCMRCVETCCANMQRCCCSMCQEKHTYAIPTADISYVRGGIEAFLPRCFRHVGYTLTVLTGLIIAAEIIKRGSSSQASTNTANDMYQVGIPILAVELALRLFYVWCTRKAAVQLGSKAEPPSAAGRLTGCCGRIATEVLLGKKYHSELMEVEFLARGRRPEEIVEVVTAAITRARARRKAREALSGGMSIGATTGVDKGAIGPYLAYPTLAFNDAGASAPFQPAGQAVVVNVASGPGGVGAYSEGLPAPTTTVTVVQPSLNGAGTSMRIIHSAGGATTIDTAGGAYPMPMPSSGPYPAPAPHLPGAVAVAVAPAMSDWRHAGHGSVGNAFIGGGSGEHAAVVVANPLARGSSHV